MIAYARHDELLRYITIIWELRHQERFSSRNLGKYAQKKDCVIRAHRRPIAHMFL